MSTTKTKITLRFGLLFLWCLFIFLLSSQPQLPGPQDKLADFLFKKAAHMFVFGVMYILAYRAFFTQQKNRRFLYAFLFCLSYAVSDEIHQRFVPGRTSAIQDIGFDVIGMGISFLKLQGYRFLQTKVKHR